MFRTLLIALCTAASLLAAPLARAADANVAGAAELESVKGIGPALSGKILAARQQAPFKSWADMVERVAGMGPGNAARFSQAGLTVGGATYSAAPAAKADAKAAKDMPAKDKAAKPAAAKS